MPSRRPLAACVALAVIACGERGEAQTQGRAIKLAEELVPRVERAVGLPFKADPQIAVRSRAQVSRYMAQMLAEEWPPAELEGVSAAYKLFGMLPDTVDLRALLLGLYTEQVVGYFDPDSNALYVVEGSDPLVLRMTMAHELVHALQSQYVPLRRLLDAERGNDARMAAQAMLEGQATLASLRVMMPDQDFNAIPDFPQAYRQAIREQQEQMPVFRSAPRLIQEELIFPYLEGANFVRWFLQQYGDTVPFGARLPRSTEQILHPERYRRGDQPVFLSLTDTAGLVYQDGLGEFETRLLLADLSHNESIGRMGANGWGGDQYGVFKAGDGNALVWWSVWDTERYADRFADLLAREWQTRRRAGRRYTIDRLQVGTRAAVRLVDAPVDWTGWEKVPGAVER